MAKYGRDFRVVATCLTKDITSHEQIKQIIDPVASYQVIPGAIDVNSGNIWKIIQDTLPLTKNMLVDIEFPFSLDMKNKFVSHRARYLLLNQRVIGIRIATGTKWERYRCQKYRLPQEIVRFYKTNGLDDYGKYNECLIGQFYIRLKNLKIAPIFLSQLTQDLKLLDEYDRYGCDVMSITDDILYQSTGYQPPVVKKIIQRTRLKPSPILLTGCRLSSHPASCYWATSFIAQGNKAVQQQLSPFINWGSIKMNVNTQQCMKHRQYLKIDQLTRAYQINDSIIDALLVQQKIRYAIGQQQKGISSKGLQYSEDVTKVKKASLYLWYLFNSYNQKMPFTVSVPFTESIWSLVLALKQLKALTKNIIKKPLLQIYYFPIKDQIIKEYWPPGTEICNQAKFYHSFESMMAVAKDANVYVYTQLNQQIRFLKQSIQRYPNIFVCRSLIVADKMPTPAEGDRVFLRQKKDTVQIQPGSQLEKICARILNKRCMTLQEMVRLFRKQNKNQQQLLTCFIDIMPPKIRTNMVLNPPFNFLIKRQRQHIQSTLIQIWTRLELNEAFQPQKQEKKEIEGKNLAVKSKGLNKTQNNATDLRSKMNQVISYKQNKAKTNIECHCCKMHIPKALIKKCPGCFKQICYQCLGRRYSAKNIELAQFDNEVKRYCPYCDRTCKCRDCRDQKQRKQKQLRQYQEKMEKEEVQLKQQKVRQAIVPRRECVQCKLKQRERKQIDIQCQRCKIIMCITCLQQDKNYNKNYYKQKFFCSECSILQKEDDEVSNLIFIIQRSGKKVRTMNAQQKQEYLKRLQQSLIKLKFHQTAEYRSLKEKIEQFFKDFDEQKASLAAKRAQLAEQLARASQGNTKQRDKQNKTKRKSASSSGSSSGSKSSSSSSSSSSSDNNSRKGKKKRTSLDTRKLQRRQSNKDQRISKQEKRPNRSSSNSSERRKKQRDQNSNQNNSFRSNSNNNRLGNQDNNNQRFNRDDRNNYSDRGRGGFGQRGRGGHYERGGHNDRGWNNDRGGYRGRGRGGSRGERNDSGNRDRFDNNRNFNSNRVSNFNRQDNDNPFQQQERQSNLWNAGAQDNNRQAVTTNMGSGVIFPIDNPKQQQQQIDY